MRTKALKALLNYPYISNAKKRILKKQIEIMQTEQELKKLKELEDIIYNLMYIYKKSHKIEKDEYILLLETKLTKLFNTLE